MSFPLCTVRFAPSLVQVRGSGAEASAGPIAHRTRKDIRRRFLRPATFLHCGECRGGSRVWSIHLGLSVTSTLLSQAGRSLHQQHLFEQTCRPRPTRLLESEGFGCAGSSLGPALELPLKPDIDLPLNPPLSPALFPHQNHS